MKDRDSKVGAVIGLVRMELDKAMRRFPPMNSPHEGWAVIKEELDELWDEIRANRGDEGPALDEAIQVAAMAIRYVVDMAEKDPGAQPQ